MPNVDLPAQVPMEVSPDGNFYFIPFPDTWRELLAEVPYLFYILEESPTFLAGGLLRTLIAQEPLSPESTDVDLFFTNEENYEIVKEWFTYVNDAFECIYSCPENKLTTFRHKSTGWKYQCISVAFYPTLLDVVNSFDFTAACFGTNGQVLVFHKSAIFDTLNKYLRWHKITYPASSLRRMMKYAQKGFHMAKADYEYFVECVQNRHPDIIDMNLVYVD